MNKRWNIAASDPVKTKHLTDELKINPSICSILVQRKVDNFEKARDYFRPQLSQLHDPFLMKDMHKAVDRITEAIVRQEKILVFGDYDVDGTTSVSLMYQFLCHIHDPALLDYYIPHRYKEGYGVSKAGIDFAAEHGFTLIISLDCGIKSADLIAYAKSLQIDFIVCDHHLPDDILPDAVAILNAKQPGCNYPYKELCGCGVGFKLISALAMHYNLEEDHYLCYLDLVVTAIAADIVPITGENRILAHYGLKRINQTPCAGIRALIELSDIEAPLNVNNVVFVIAPRINAAGRMDDAKKAVQLFIEKDYEKAIGLAKILQLDNTDRKEADKNITEEALEMIGADQALINRKTTVVYQEHWHKGVVGIVASRLIETYYRPTVVLTKSGDVVAGSARSVPGFNLYEAIHACKDSLLGYGGHFAAAGLSLCPDKVDVFSRQFEQVVSNSIEERLLIPENNIDSVIQLNEINDSLYNIICQMEPFGPENMRPLFMLKAVRDTGYSKVVKDLHIRFVINQNNQSITGIGFNLAKKFHIIENKKPFDIAFTIDENEWNGNKSIQLKVIDIRPAV